MHIPFDIDQPSSTFLHTKNLTCVYEDGRLKYIKTGNTELVRTIYGSVRDADWETVTCQIRDEHIQQKEDNFIITYTAYYQQNDIAFEAVYRIEGKPDDTITFDMQGKALSSFKSNRIGLCMHLPIRACAGIPVSVTHPKGTETATRFPVCISPHQPFSQVERLYWKTEKNTAIQISFRGEVFEAEDQRNWMDYSYKIYSRPLSLPFPFKVAAGEVMQQTIKVNVVPAADMTADAISVVNNKPVSLPDLGIAAAEEPALLTREETSLLHALPFSHYRAELDLERDNWKIIFAIHIENAKALGVTLVLVLFFTDNYINEAALLLELLYGHATIVKSILPQHKDYKVTPAFLQQYFYPLVKKKFNDIQVGYGTDIYFAELNRQRPENDCYDFVGFSINPQVHNFDAKTMLENIEAIDSIIQTIRSFTSKPIVVSPVTLKKRKNHDGAGASMHNLVNNFDERLHTWFGAGWFLLCLYALHGVQQVSFFKTTGTGGILRNVNELSPLYLVLQQLRLLSPDVMKKNKNRLIFKNRQGEEMDFLLDELYFESDASTT